MTKAAELTRSGKLQEATAMIQSLLQSSVPASNLPATELGFAGAVIDGDFTRLEPENTPPRAVTSKAKPERQKPRASTTPLVETLRKIAAGGMPVRGLQSGQADPVPEGAQFLSLTHSAALGSRSYRLYIPANRRAAKMPLIVMLHGCTQTPEDFAAGTGMNALAEEFGCMIAYPAQPSGANAQKCWNWYRPEDQARDRGEPALIAGLTRAIWRNHNADRASTYIAGLSAGGAAAAVMAAAYPDIFSAVGVHSGLPAGSAQDIPSAFAAMRSGSKGRPHRTIVPTIVFHGLADSTVHPDNGQAVLSQALHAMPGLRATTRRGVAEGGHRYRTTAHHHPDGRSLAEHWQIEGAGHAWAGGHSAGSYTDPLGPDASRQMVRFFLQNTKS
ncbi:PHB depolymerase family esterase [Tabrizicola sp.]|uniref:extracellular catalytic domain type 1 short-chain-length polyhydroxyalkanoate depolymerase n=1 Tax=Tabrizicola sp. TaxID=2005166 RepID=UPI00286CD2D5|nr:PHB depolymerase family esterase [Tabrizicola sp.]